MADSVEHASPPTVMEDVVVPTPSDCFDHAATNREKNEMRKAIKPPSEWLRLICKQWAEENGALVDGTDAKFMDYKPYLKGMLTSQLLCRLSIPVSKEVDAPPPYVDFWGILGIEDEFDKAYIIAQVERFCSHFNIRGVPLEEDPLFSTDYGAGGTAADAISPHGHHPHHHHHHHHHPGDMSLPPYDDASRVDTASPDVARFSSRRDASSLRDTEKPMTTTTGNAATKREQRRVAQERKEQKAREREASAVRKAEERTAREASREERKRKKNEIREEREKRVKEQKEAALQRAAELVSSNRVPIEITRGADAAKAAANAVLAAVGESPLQDAQKPAPTGQKKQRSAIVVSTAGDLHAICTHAKNLWAKYNAIAREHNKKVGWGVVAKELGIHVKVREKYSRMHARAKSRGFDFVQNADWKIKDHPELFLEPTAQEKKSKIPPIGANAATTVVLEPNQIPNVVMEPTGTLQQIPTNAEPTTTLNNEAAAEIPTHHHHEPSMSLKDETTLSDVPMIQYHSTAEDHVDPQHSHGDSAVGGHEPTANDDHGHDDDVVTDEAVAAAAAAAAVVDASVNAHHATTEEQAAAAEEVVAATMIDPTPLISDSVDV